MKNCDFDTLKQDRPVAVLELMFGTIYWELQVLRAQYKSHLPVSTLHFGFLRSKGGYWGREALSLGRLPPCVVLFLALTPLGVPLVPSCPVPSSRLVAVLRPFEETTSETDFCGVVQNVTLQMSKSQVKS